MLTEHRHWRGAIVESGTTESDLAWVAHKCLLDTLPAFRGIV